MSINQIDGDQQDEYVDEGPSKSLRKRQSHELQVLEGARGLLSRKQIRDVIFEDFTPYPGPVPQLLLDHGYRVFRLHSALFGPSLQPGETAAGGLRPTGNYLATLDPDRARERFRTRGWQVLRGASKP